MTFEITKICSECGINKLITDFTKGKGACKKCCVIKTQKYNNLHKEEVAAYHKKYNDTHKNQKKEADALRYKNNKEHMDAIHKIWTENNKDFIIQYNKEFRKNNKEYFSHYMREYEKNRKNNDAIFKSRKEISSKVANALKRQGNSKNKKSILEYLPYSFQELKESLEKQFEPWMNWNNRGKYNPKTWDDNNSSTWTWQLDHIIPQSDLPYDSMDHENFQKCWALENLRPYSAKQNIIDGVSRIRHIIKKI